VEYQQSMVTFFGTRKVKRMQGKENCELRFVAMLHQVNQGPWRREKFG